MRLESLLIERFRQFDKVSFPVPEPGLRIIGANASGKSSILEAVAMLATTRSPRTSTDREVINWESGRDLGVPPFARVVGSGVRGQDRLTVELSIAASAVSAGERETETTEPRIIGTVRKRFKVNDRPRRAMDVVGQLSAVMFSPEDVGLIGGPPADRRRLLDVLIAQVDGEYLRALSRYGKVLSQRNGLLKSFARVGTVSEQSAKAQLAFWDEELVEAGSVIVAWRLAVVNRVSDLAERRYRELADGATFRAAYHASLSTSQLERDLGEPPSLSPRAILEQQGVIARTFEHSLTRRRSQELTRGQSLVGPHRDDLIFQLDNRDLSAYGSRGQQRLAVLAWKMAEADLLTAVDQEAPVVLLDDVMSELDPNRSVALLRLIASLGSQVLLTATNDDVVSGPAFQHMPILRTESLRTPLENAP